MWLRVVELAIATSSGSLPSPERKRITTSECMDVRLPEVNEALRLTRGKKRISGENGLNL